MSLKITNPYFKTLVATIEDPSSEVISFDIFDTAVVRPFLRPTDLFKYLTPKIREVTGLFNFTFDFFRQTAEQKAREILYKENQDSDITIDDIYNILAEKIGISSETADIIKQIEIEAEIQHTYQNSQIYYFYDLALKNNKKIIFCSDMYLPKDSIIKLLEKSGYNTYHALFLSNDCKASKRTGSMYDYVSAYLHVDPKKIVHIGDNKKTDFNKALERGWQAFHVPSPIALMQTRDSAHKKIWDVSLMQQNLPVSIFLAMFANKYCNAMNPSSFMTLFDNDKKRFGYYAVGPFLYELLMWIKIQAQKNNIDHIFFLSRDGYLPLEAWKMLRLSDHGGPRVSYLYSSRLATTPLMITEGDPSSLLFTRRNISSRLTIADFIKARFPDIPATRILELITSARLDINSFAIPHWDDLQKFFNDHHEHISQLLKPFADSSRNYYTRELSIAKHPAIFDVGRFGTVFNLLTSLIRPDIHAFFVTTESPIGDNAEYGKHDSFLGQALYGAPFRDMASGIFEGLLSYTGPSISHWEKDGTERFREESQLTGDTKDNIEQIQNGALQFIQDVYDHFGNSLFRYNVQPQVALHVLKNMWDFPKEYNIVEPLEFPNFEAVPGGTVSLAKQYHKFQVAPARRNKTHIVFYCPKLSTVSGGAERVTAYLATYLHDQNYSVSILTSGKGAYDPDSVYSIPAQVSVFSVDDRKTKNFRDMFRQLRPAAVICLSSGARSVKNIALAANRLGIPLMLSERAAPDHSIEMHWDGCTKQYFKTYARAQVIALQFDGYKNYFPKMLRHKTIVLPNPVFRREQAPFENRKQRIVCVARIFLQQKRQDLLIKAFSMIAQEFPEWELHLYGTPWPGEHAIVQQLIEELSLTERIILHGEVSDIFSVYDQAAIFAFPSKYEGFPNSLAEALSSGLPAVGYKDCPGTNKLIQDGENGFLVENIEEFAQALAKLMRSRELREAMSRKAISSMQQYDAETVLKKWKEAVADLIKQRQNIFAKCGPLYMKLYKLSWLKKYFMQLKEKI